MEKRVLIAITLSFLVLYGYQTLLVKQVPSQTRKIPPASAPEAGPPASNSSSAPAGTGQHVEQAPPAAAPLLGGGVETDVRVDTPTVEAVFTNRGAELKYWRLKPYRDPQGKPVDVLAAPAKASERRPFSLVLEDAAAAEQLRSALFKPSQTHLSVASGTGSLAFEYADAAGLTARKEFVFDAAQPYVVRVRATVARGSQALTPGVYLGPGLGDSTAPVGQYTQSSQAIFYRDGSMSRISSDSLGEQATQDGDFGFAGIDDQYFIAATLSGAPVRVEYQVLPPRAPDAPPLLGFTTRAREAREIRYFIGPKDFDVLAGVDRDFVRAINFGMFSWLCVPLLRSLKWIYGYCGNYGWAIIILTVLINAAMFPLRHKSVVSMRKMQDLQPEVKAIQDRYAKLKTTDPARQKMNVELMNLYRERGVNPASGCVPMILTMPVLFAFYSLLSQAIEIRGAPFVLWIQDLSVHDPFYVTPLMMGGTMVWQQSMTPITDPTQQKMMMFMPIIFTAMFLWAPSGLVLYWLVSNVWAIGQQKITNRIIGPPVVRTVRPPAERKMKKAGSGKTAGATE